MIPRAGRPPGWSGGALIGLAVLALLPALGAGAPSPAVSGATGAGCTPGSGLILNATPSTGSAPMTVQFAISDPHGPPTWVNWSFGDGSPPANGQGDPFLSTSHRYTAWGLFEAVVNITQGARSLLCAAAIEVNPPPLALTIHATPQTGPVPLTVHFTVNLSGGTSVIDRASWTFGDGSTATGFDVNYTYSAPGNYTATFTVLDNANQSAQDGVRILANASVPRNASNGPGTSWTLPTWALEATAGLALLFAVGLFLSWRAGALGRSSGDEGGPQRSTPEPAEEVPAFPAREGAPPAEPTPPTFVEEVPARPAAAGNGLSAALAEPLAPVVAVTPSSEGHEPAPAIPSTSPEPEQSGGPRLKLSQRVMLHLYLQGHLADGEVAPFGFTQGGMAEKLRVAQSPLSSVLRRLVVAGLVSQDTRHVRGQPRRLRVYRLTPVGEVVARDLYRQSVEGSEASHRDD